MLTLQEILLYNNIKDPLLPTTEKVEFEDGSKIEFAKMNYDDKVFRDHYKALLWWKSKE